VVLALVGGLLLGLAMVVIVLVSSVGAVAGTCRQAAGEASQAVRSGSSDFSGASGPSYVSQEWSEKALSDVPADYLPLYEEAAREYGLDAAILAAIGKIETDHGRYDGTCATSSAGAQGPMQFIPSTWANAGVDGNGDGRKDVCDPADAIPSAANYLQLSGAPQDYHSAILAYNHAEWYYQDVVAQAEEYRAAGSEGGGGEMAGSPVVKSASGLATLLSPFAMRPAHAEEATGTVGNPGETDYSPVEIETLGLINGYREENGLEPLLLSDHLSTASARYAHDMAKHDAYGVPEPHITGPTDYYFEGATLTDRMNEEGYFASRYGENIAAGQDTAEKVFEAWRGSPPHNAMMLNGEMRVVGIGLVENPGTSYGEFWVTDFGSDQDSTSRPVSDVVGSRVPGEESFGGSGVEGNTKAGEGGVAPGAPSADLPAYCAPLQALGIVPEVTQPLAEPSFAGGVPVPAELTSGAPTGSGSATGQQVVEEAEKYVGVPYVLGGPEACVPGEQMDCTCLTTTVFREFGYELPDMPTDLMGYGEPVEGPPQAGDVLVWDDPGDGTGGHVAISMGDGQIIHANMGTMDTSITPMWDSPNYLGARRLVE
jgi:uncharacterized protein YkwD